MTAAIEIGPGPFETEFVIDTRPGQSERRLTSDERFLLLRATKELLRQYERDFDDYHVYGGDQDQHYFRAREKDIYLLNNLVNELSI
ncbi:hypothetical protein ACFVH6_25555 [Spirillospora sp. NPDC127200]